ncbi:MAG: nitroreductase family protein [Oscillospiraceae bacterium]|nr:nitroreductase family protein [Oscillospiraceae bacterium]
MELFEAIKQRHSIRKYTGQTISEEKFKLLLEAAMFAPSACNSRPWYFVVIKNQEKLTKITEFMTFAGMLKTAKHAILVCANLDSQKFGMYPQDCSAATQNILLRAVELGLGTC